MARKRKHWNSIREEEYSSEDCKGQKPKRTLTAASVCQRSPTHGWGPNDTEQRGPKGRSSRTPLPNQESPLAHQGKRKVFSDTHSLQRQQVRTPPAWPVPGEWLMQCQNQKGERRTNRKGTTRLTHSSHLPRLPPAKKLHSSTDHGGCCSSRNLTHTNVLILRNF